LFFKAKIRYFGLYNFVYYITS